MFVLRRKLVTNASPPARKLIYVVTDSLESFFYSAQANNYIGIGFPIDILGFAALVRKSVFT